MLPMRSSYAAGKLTPAEESEERLDQMQSIGNMKNQHIYIRK